MRNKFIPLAVALIFGSVAVVGFSQMMKAGPQVESVEVYVANRVINAREEITQAAIQLEQWPADRVPQDAIRDWNELEGKFASQRLFAGEPVLVRKLMDSNDTRTVDIPKGFNVVALKADEISSVANLVAPGDRVNVIGFFTRSEVIPETTTKTVLSGVRVFAVDGRTKRQSEDPADDKKNQVAKTVSLLIHNGDAEVLAWSRELAQISLSLGRPDDGGTSEEEMGPNPAGQAFLRWLSDHQAKLDALKVKPAVEDDNQSPLFPPPQQPKSAKVAHQMVKIGDDGQISVFTWEEGNPIPKVTTPAAAEATNNQSSSKTTPNLDYLNGSSSPLFKGSASQPPGQIPTFPTNEPVREEREE